MSGPRIIAGAWRGRALAVPEGVITRPTSGRVKQALFDILLHAPWAEGAVADQSVLDAFAGSGALGLEALSRGAAVATFIEQDRAAIAALHRNVAACRAADRSRIVSADILAPPRGTPHGLILLDPPYGKGLVPRAVRALAEAGWLAPGALIAAEFGKADPPPADLSMLAERAHGAARLVIWRHAT